jgi:hypothetical protein
MIAEPDFQEYLDEIRQQVCSRCIERPPGGPPCAPLGKRCGIELNLQRLVEAVQSVNSTSLDPYIAVYHAHVCTHCTNRPTSQCPCPLDYLLPLAVEAIETVNERRQLAAERPPNGVNELHEPFEAVIECGKQCSSGGVFEKPYDAARGRAQDLPESVK